MLTLNAEAEPAAPSRIDIHVCEAPRHLSVSTTDEFARSSSPSSPRSTAGPSSSCAKRTSSRAPRPTPVLAGSGTSTDSSRPSPTIRHPRSPISRPTTCQWAPPTPRCWRSPVAANAMSRRRLGHRVAADRRDWFRTHLPLCARGPASRSPGWAPGVATLTTGATQCTLPGHGTQSTTRFWPRRAQFET